MSEPIFTASVEITEPHEYVDRSLQTASWWDRYEIHPQTATVEIHERGWHVSLKATLVETYRVNRLFTASSAETTHPQTEETVILTGYSYLYDPSHYTTWEQPHLFGHPVEADPTDLALFALRWVSLPYDRHERQVRVHRLLGWIASSHPEVIFDAVRGLKDSDRQRREAQRA